MKKIPKGQHAVTPWIISRDTARLIAFMTEAFGAEEKPDSRITNEDGTIGHAELEIGDSVILAFDAKPDWPETPAFLRIYVKHADVTYVRALEAGATTVTTPTDLAFGERVARVRDPEGNVWWIHQRIEKVDEEELEKRATDPGAVAAMQYVEESLAQALSNQQVGAGV